MTTVWDGKHLWIWYISQTESGNTSAMLTKAKELGLAGVLIKAWDGTNEWGQFKWNVQLFKSHGFKVGAWGYCYGNDVQGEAQQAIKAANYGADWLVIDAEKEYEGKQAEAKQFGQLLRAGAPQIPIGLSSFAITYYHKSFPYSEFAGFVNVMLPQDYWVDIGWPVTTATLASMKLGEAYGIPVAPVGQAYGRVTPKDIQMFVQDASKAGASGVSFWSWQAASASQLNAIGVSELSAPQDSASGNGGSTTAPGTAGTTSPSNAGSGRSSLGGGSVSSTGVLLPGDVPADAWYASAAAYVIAKGYMTAPGNKFNPQETVTRAMLAEVLYNEGRDRT